ncbi:MAG: carboxypeptidase regulatory-like domain-containing protein [Saprospiraceae bacterium]|nr:carboxypeptidase regulatory-like domain-containing protein [Saprospiraceae bacterium]
MKNAIIFLFSILLFASCKKDFEGIEIKGRITEVGSGKPVSGAKVTIVGRGSDGSPWLSGGGISAIVDSVFTDANGHYSYRNVESPFGGYIILISKDKYQPANPPHGFDNGFPHNFDYQLQPYAWVKIHLKNVNPVNESDWVEFFGSFARSISTADNIYMGMNVDKIIYEPTYGNYKILIYYKYIKSNIKYSDSIEVFTPAHDTIPLDIFY